MTTERKNISQPSDWWLAFEEAAKKEGVTLSSWIGNQCRAAIKKPSSLSDRPAAHRPKKPDK